MTPKHVTTFLPSGCLLVLSALSCLSSPSTAFDVLHSLEAEGLTPRMLDLSMSKVGGANNNNNKNKPAPAGLDRNRDGNNFGAQLITNGDDAYPKEFKHQAALLINTSAGFFQICGAILVSGYHALTAAHCLPYLTGEKNKTYDHFIAVGLHNLTLGLGNPGSQISAVLDYQIHYDYGDDRPGYPNDIAMLYLEGLVLQNSFVQYARLATPGMGNFAKTTCRVSGWGLTEIGRPDILQWGYQYIPTPRDCKNFWGISKAARISKRHVCGYNYPVQACSGDSGGPLTCEDVVVGIVSWGLANCSGCFPGVYTRISFHFRWIRKAMSFSVQIKK